MTAVVTAFGVPTVRGAVPDTPPMFVESLVLPPPPCFPPSPIPDLFPWPGPLDSLFPPSLPVPGLRSPGTPFGSPCGPGSNTSDDPIVAASQQELAPRPLTWQSSIGQLSGTISGGRHVAVNVEAISALAGLLELATDHAEQAQSHLLHARTALDIQPVPTIPGAPLASLTELDEVDAAVLEMQRQRAIEAIDDALAGPTSLASALEETSALALVLCQVAEVYAEAEASSQWRWREGFAIPFFTSFGSWLRHHLPSMPMPSTSLPATFMKALGLTWRHLPEEVKNVYLRQAGVVGDIAQEIDVIASDDELSPWARRELRTLLELAALGGMGATGVELGVTESVLAERAHNLAPQLLEHLPPFVQQGSRMVPRESLGAMQVVAAYLALAGTTSAASRFGSQSGLLVSSLSGGRSIVGKAAARPFGLDPSAAVPAAVPRASSRVSAASALTGGEGTTRAQAPSSKEALRALIEQSRHAERGPLAAGNTSASSALRGRQIEALRTPSQVVAYSDAVAEDSSSTEGVISVVRVEHGNGTRSWMVVIPGTRNVGLGGPNPQDMLSNFQGVAGLPTDVEVGVVTAMKEAGIQYGEEVALYGHSQGAITAATLAADPFIHEHFTISNVLTAGGPVAGADLPDSVQALHVENSADAIPSLDASGNPIAHNRLTLRFEGTCFDVDGHPHEGSSYAKALEGLPSDGDLVEWRQGFDAISAAEDSSATFYEERFTMRRLYGSREEGATP